jgi:hypothetical protein
MNEIIWCVEKSATGVTRYTKQWAEDTVKIAAIAQELYAKSFRDRHGANMQLPQRNMIDE